MKYVVSRCNYNDVLQTKSFFPTADIMIQTSFKRLASRKLKLALEGQMCWRVNQKQLQEKGKY